MYFAILEESLMVSLHIIITATVFTIFTAVDCFKKKEFTVEPTQPSITEHSKIIVYNRDGETDIEMPLHLNKMKESGENGQLDEKESGKMKKTGAKNGKNELETKSETGKSEIHHSGKEKQPEKERKTVISGCKAAKNKNEKLVRKKQSGSMKESASENKEKSTTKQLEI
uniref:Uncharacterized protein n=1 Tax=Setaria digitata TaxID=48799 RepID=A0A915PM75_9BILA